MANIKQAYAASSALTITLASLATSSTLLVGQESDAVDNTTNLYLDYLLAGRIATGTTPTAGQIEVHVVAMLDDVNWPDAFDGANSGETIVDANVKNMICRPAAVMTTGTASNQTYPFGPVSVANLFGGTLPKKWVAFVTHNTVAALNATAANHLLVVTPAYATST